MLDLADRNRGSFSVQVSNERVTRLEKLILQAPQTDLKTRHFLVDGPNGTKLYGREITVPAEAVITGAAHKHDCLCISIGDIEVTTDDGTPKRLTGYHAFTAPAGRKRAGNAFAETKWITLHVVTSQTIDDIERELFDQADELQAKLQRDGQFEAGQCSQLAEA